MTLDSLALGLSRRPDFARVGMVRDAVALCVFVDRW
jgi:hypothetical protein